MSPKQRAKVEQTATFLKIPVTPRASLLPFDFWAYLICFGLVAVTWFVYRSVSGHEFLDWDDNEHIANNRHLLNGLTVESVVYAFTTFDTANWIPVTWLSIEIDSTLFGLNSKSLHLTNLLWHTLNVCFVFYVLRRLTGSQLRSAIVAAFFAVHPLHVESVAWISERKDLLSTFALLGALVAYLRYVDSPSLSRYSVVAVTFAIGLMAKPMLVTLPILLLLLDFWPLRRTDDATSLLKKGAAPLRARFQTWKHLVLEKVPLLTLAMIDGVITVVAQSDEAIVYLEHASLVSRLSNAIYGYEWYVLKTFWPSGLSAYYPHSGISLPWLDVIQASLFLTLICGYVVRRRAPWLVVGWLWFVISLLPVIGLLQVGGQAYADRYVYIPHIGLFVMIVWEADFWLEKLGRRVRLAGFVISFICIAVLSVTAKQRVNAWRDTESLWNQAILVDRFNPRAHFILGEYCAARQRFEEAEEHFADMLVTLPNNSKTVSALARLFLKQNRPDVAINYYDWLLRLLPNSPSAQQNSLNLAKFRTTKPISLPKPEAFEEVKQGVIAANQQLFEVALGRFEKAVELDPESTLVHHFIANCLDAMGRYEDAARHFEHSLRIDQQDKEAWHGLNRLKKLKLIQSIE